VPLDPFYDIDPSDLNRLLSEPVRNYVIAENAREDTMPIDLVVGTYQQATARLQTIRANMLASGDPTQLKGMVIVPASEQQLTMWNERGA
jgi:hypothetical protein